MLGETLPPTLQNELIFHFLIQDTHVHLPGGCLLTED